LAFFGKIVWLGGDVVQHPVYFVDHWIRTSR